MKKGPLIEQGEEEWAQRQQRQEKAVNKFSKQRFMKTSQPAVEEKREEVNVTKIAVANLIKKNLKVDLGETLARMGVDFKNPEKNIPWLSLSFYDHRDHERIPIGEDFEVSARCLVVKQQACSFVRGRVQAYSEDKNKYLFVGEHSGSASQPYAAFVPRVYLCVDTEDPHRYCEWVAKAFLARIYADNLIKVDHCIDAMPTEGLIGLAPPQRLAIKNSLKAYDEEATDSLLEEASASYKRTMNSIVFKKHFNQSRGELLPIKMMVSLARQKKSVPLQGLIAVAREKEVVFEDNEKNVYKSRTFVENFRSFCEHTIQTEKNVVVSVRQIKQECEKRVGEGLFRTQVRREAVRFEQYQAEQNGQLQRNINRLKNEWGGNVKAIIEAAFKKNQVPWFDFAISAAHYADSRMRRFFRLVKYIMEDTLLQISLHSFTTFVHTIELCIPDRVDIPSIYAVRNHFADGRTIANVPGQKPNAYFQTDLMHAFDDSAFHYSTPTGNFVTVILGVFNRTLDEMNKISEVDDKVLVEAFKKERVESFLRCPNLKDTPPHHLDQNIWIKQLHHRLRSKLEAAIEPVDNYLKLFNQLMPILKMKPEEIVKEVDREDEENAKDVAILKEEIEGYYAKERDILSLMPEHMFISCFKINLRDTVEHLAKKYHQTAYGLEGVVGKKAKKATNNLLQKFKEISKKIDQKAPNIEKLIEMRDYMLGVPTELEKLQKEIEESNAIYEVLDEFKFMLTTEDIRKRYTVMTKPKNIVEEIGKKQGELEACKIEFEEQLLKQQEEFKNTLETLSRSVAQFHMHNKKDQHAEIAQKVELINEALAQLIAQAKQFNSRENLFEKEITDYSKVHELAKDFIPYSHLWLTTTNWFKNIANWMLGEWNSINAEDCERFVETAITHLLLAIRFFKEKEIVHILKIAEGVKLQIDEFRPKVPLLLALRKQGLKDRHWDQLSAKVGFKVYPTVDFTFAKALEMGLLAHLDSCIELSEQASKEWNIETSLNAMMGVWDGVNFEFAQFKSGVIIKTFDDIIAVVDDHIANTQSMLFSPYKKPFEQRIMDWFAGLKKISDIMEEWTKLQVGWMYLQPIFDSPDIAKQLHKESKNFKTTDLFWRATLSRARELSNVWRFTSDDDLLDKFKENNSSLDLIQKSLNTYLENKRGKFARFYFLSNNQLLEILSQAKEPLAVQPYLKKVFENINEVEFEGNKMIVAMLSAEQERVRFVRSIDPKNKNVEDWMTEVEEQMKVSLRSVLLESIKDYQSRRREHWVMVHPGQCVLNGSQVCWTAEVESHILAHTVRDYFDQLTRQLNLTVELVRQKLSKNQSITLNALIVVDVHARDVVDSLQQNEVADANAFEWISQLRYYWQADNCQAKCVQTVFPYGYEYLGNTLRLVITPLTDKCYMTLMGALKLNLGGAPAGPAGTGKTETTKDLAKALAKQCVVFNCSDSMDFIMVGKFFKGLAAAGAWACFDEFNRINIQVLSVIAQQLLILFGEKAKGSTQIEFEGSEIRLQPTFSVFITMNPGYAGRTELPDNLKALFRPVAMMVPDYAMIGEIMLYSFGFKKGRELAKKMVATFRLASEQLSSQDHYDYWMRAVRSVINAAGILKEKDPFLEEDKLLLRALKDVNVPKFLKDDLPLFDNIIQDLFPETEKPAVDYGQLMEEIHRVCEAQCLEATPVFLAKTMQLFDTIQVRHGLMLVGPTGGGKTETYTVLKTALTNLLASGYYKVNTHVINPKAITMGQLYGQFNEASREWIDGVLASTVRKCCADRTTNKHWIMLDGPVDALWIENMNTVLDDNKKLCLNSGQILTLTPHMTMMFEVEDLTVASPATVSRCGMVYMEPSALGVSPLTYQWKRNLPQKVVENRKITATLYEFVEDVLYPMLAFTRKHCKELVPTIDQNLVQSYFRILNCYLSKYVATEGVKITPEDITRLEQSIEKICQFSVVWSVGGSTDHEGRAKFNTQLRAILAKKNRPLLPNFFECYFNEKTQQFQAWRELYTSFEIDSSQEYHQMIVPTADSARAGYLSKLLLERSSHVMVPGPTGTGKSVNAFSLLTYHMSDVYQYIPLSFSAQTSANQTQDTIDSKLEKIKRGVFGAPVGKKYVVFVDDLNMPKKEEYGAQPPIELLRQFLDHHGWYNRRDQLFMRIENLIFLAALGPPGGGRTHLTPRLVRHFNLLANCELDSQTISSVFSQILKFFLRKFTPEVQLLTDALILSVLQIYDSIRKELLPTPKKSHYTFNLRDISKVFQGICSVSAKYCSNREAVARLWCHEVTRVFGDRLTNSEDRLFLKERIKENVVRLSPEPTTTQTPLIFSDFWHGIEQEPRHYMEIPDYGKVIDKIYEFQEEYNGDPRFSGARGKNAMRLVLFQDACEHISRIVRIIRQPMGNALLLGVGGSGRQSLAKLAIFVSKHALTFIELVKNYNMKSWREDLKRILMQTGLENKKTSFLVTDAQIINEQMVEDINSVLNSGDVTGLYQEKEMEDILSACKGDCLKKGLQPNKMNIYGQFVARVKQNIHIVMAMSPLSHSFSTRLRMFPSLVNCCTLDWFGEWPEEALLAVGKGQLKQFIEENGLSEKEASVIEVCKTIHKSVEISSTKYLDQLRRYNYVTPMSYLELLTMFKMVLKDKQLELKTSINRLKSGLNKLTDANAEVAEMQIQLKDLQPQLEKSAIETTDLIKQIEVEKKEAQETEKTVSREESEALIQTEEALLIAKEVDIKVQDANAKLAESLKAVDKLKTDNIVEIKSIKNPSKTALIVLGGCVIFFQDMIAARGREIIMKKIEGSIKKEEDWMNTARIELLDNPKNFLEQLKGYDKEHINQALIAKFNQKIVKDPDFTFEKAKLAGVCIEALFQWEMAMYSFNQIYINTQPLREREAEVKQLVAEKTAMLKEKKKILAGVIEKIANLERTYNQCIHKKEELKKKIVECEVKLQRAKKLTSGLSGEKERWTIEVQRLQSLTKYLLGNSMLSAAALSYSGAFTADYRMSLHEIWCNRIQQLGIEIEAKTNLVSFLGKAVTIQQWTVAGLPKDQNSIENGLIIEKGRRWPLMIDPQGQANKFIKTMGKETHIEGLDVVKEKEDTKLMKTLELAIQNGKWFLLENVGKQLDQSLQPILLQQVVKTSGSLSITFGDKTLAYNNEFKLLMTTMLPNPHYSPQTFVKVTVINFAITPQGLQEQMLAELVALENPQLEQKKREIVKRNAADEKQLQSIEDNILQSLSQGSGGVAELLLDQTLINQLQNSKKFAAEINQRIQDSKITEEQIDVAREGYRSVAYRASILFFCIIDLAVVDPMYQYSLRWFTALFKMAVQNALPAKELEVRLTNLTSYFTHSLYENVCRSLFQKHKLLFSFILTAKIQFGKHDLDPDEWRYFLAGPSGDFPLPPNPAPWISDSSWNTIYRLFHGFLSLPKFKGLYEFFLQQTDKFKPIFDSAKPQECELPAPWSEKLDSFQRLLVLKAIRLDKVLPGIEGWISIKLGHEFIIPPTFDLPKCYKDSTNLTPLIFLLSPGSDPVTDFLKFAKEMEKRTQSISLGQGQGPKAQQLVKSGQLKGTWILLQNCHLAASWMPQLERIVEQFSQNTHRQFRLWLTSMPTPSFPIPILQNSVKMTIQPPQGLRANLLRSYIGISESQFSNTTPEYKKLLFGFCFFHAIIQDRRKFGPIGWNIPYQFTSEDLSVCKKQLKMLLDEYQSIPYKVLNYLGAQINYGGRVTDDKDVRLIKTLLTRYITPQVFKSNYKFSKSGHYYAPNLIQLNDYITYIESLPLNPSPEAFGLHENAEITTAQNQTLSLLQAILAIEPRTNRTSGQSRQAMLYDLAQSLQGKTPALFPIHEIMTRYPTDYNESMNTVLVQELVRYNRLIQVMRVSLANLKKALKGLVVMSEDLQKLSNSLYDNQVPKLWADKGFLSLKPLGTWGEDLASRITFFQSWITHGTPHTFWLSGFFFPQAFVTGTLQNYARKKQIAIDCLSFRFSFLDSITHQDIKDKPQFGCYIYGMFLEGCRWNTETHALSESKPKQLFSQVPLMHLLPTQNKEAGVKAYQCPLYKVVSRSGTLSTTGHSTNFVMFLELPTQDKTEDWVCSGVAAFLSLRY